MSNGREEAASDTSATRPQRRATRRKKADAAFDTLVHQPQTIDQVKLLGLVFATGLFTYLSYRLLSPFLMPTASALALTVLMAPTHRMIRRHVRWPSVAAFISVVLALLLIALPVSVVIERLLADVAQIGGTVQELTIGGGWRRLLNGAPWIVDVLAFLDRNADLSRLTRDLSAEITSWVPAVLQTSTEQIVALVIALYFMFYMLRDRDSALAAITALSPLPAGKMEELYQLLADTIRTTVFGTLLIAIIQGTVAGMAFWVAGIPSPLLWGAVTALAATVPMLGTVAVWGPAVAWLFLNGQNLAATLLLAWSAIVVASIDNLLFPLLVGGRLRMHTIPTFVSLVGGVISFGPAGLILGPAILTITVFLIGFWRQDPVPANRILSQQQGTSASDSALQDHG